MAEATQLLSSLREATRGGGAPLYLQLKRGIEDAVLAGMLAPVTLFLPNVTSPPAPIFRVSPCARLCRIWFGAVCWCSATVPAPSLLKGHHGSSNPCPG